MRLIQRIARITAPGLAQAVIDNDRLFGQITVREEAPGSPHVHTKSIYLRWPAISTPQTVLYGFDDVDHPALTEVPAFSEAIAAIEKTLGKRVHRALIAKLAPGGHIWPHIDQGSYAEATDRYHLPIITNPWAWLQAGYDRVFMRRDVLYAFDKSAPHFGRNDGATPRVHLIADTLK